MGMPEVDDLIKNDINQLISEIFEEMTS